jgi:hypothetical protein
MLLFVVGGGVPWLWQINQLPTVLFLASGLEIFASSLPQELSRPGCWATMRSAMSQRRI